MLEKSAGVFAAERRQCHAHRLEQGLAVLAQALRRISLILENASSMGLYSGE